MKYMKQYSSKLIVIRGNSASGKSTVARMIRMRSNRKIAYVEQDNIRRTILKEKETDDGANIALIQQIVEFALERDYDVILEGILKFKRYGKMLQNLKNKCPDHIFFYFDTSFEETLKRHQTKPIAQEVNHEMLKSWFLQDDHTHFENEYSIDEEKTAEEAVDFIIKTAVL
jgi:predicted kinase